MAEAPKTAKQIADEAFAADEARRKAQTVYDPKVHGAGTMPIEEPGSVKEMFHKIVKPLLSRVKDLEDAVGEAEEKIQSLLTKPKKNGGNKPADDEGEQVQ